MNYFMARNEPNVHTLTKIWISMTELIWLLTLIEETRIDDIDKSFPEQGKMYLARMNELQSAKRRTWIIKSTQRTLMSYFMGFSAS